MSQKNTTRRPPKNCWIKYGERIRFKHYNLQAIDEKLPALPTALKTGSKCSFVMQPIVQQYLSIHTHTAILTNFFCQIRLIIVLFYPTPSLTC